MLDRPGEYTLMRQAEDQLWWYKMLHFQVVKLLSKENRNIRILDLGCGTGGLLDQLSNLGFEKLSGIDLSVDAVQYCKERGHEVIQGNAEDAHTFFEKNTFDVIVCNDVLCYFEKERWTQLLSQFSMLLKPNGRFIANVPTLKAFSGMHDRSVGIVYRTSKSELKQLIPSTFRLSNSAYWPFFLSPIVFLARTWQRFQMKRNPQIEITSDVKMPGQFVNQVLWMITKTEYLLGRLKPWGSSLFFVLKKNESN